MRVVLVSTHIDQTTGYSKVAFNMLKQLSTLAPKVKTYHFGFQRHPSKAGVRKASTGVVQYDAVANEDPKEEGFGFNKIYEYLEMVSPDVVMIYNDPLVVHKFIENMKHERGVTPYKLWVYVDQVYEGIAQPLIASLNAHADRIYCFTDSWVKTYQAYDDTFKDIRVIEHAIDPTTFTCLPKDVRGQLRKNMNIPSDAIVFLNANRNSQRKRLDLTISGFVDLLERNPEKLYYLMLVTSVNVQTGAYYDVQRIFQSELKRRNLDLQSFIQRLLLIDTAPPNVLSDEAINQIYNMSDIGINTSDGEGFGLCQLEHLYTGAPQIVTDVGSYRSFLSDDVAEFVPARDRVYFSGNMPLGLYSMSFSPEDVTKAMENMIEKLPERCAAVNKYNFKSWATVCDGWLEDVIAAAT